MLYYHRGLRAGRFTGFDSASDLLLEHGNSCGSTHTPHSTDGYSCGSTLHTVGIVVETHTDRAGMHVEYVNTLRTHWQIMDSVRAPHKAGASKSFALFQEKAKDAASENFVDSWLNQVLHSFLFACAVDTVSFTRKIAVRYTVQAHPIAALPFVNITLEKSGCGESDQNFQVHFDCCARATAVSLHDCVLKKLCMLLLIICIC